MIVYHSHVTLLCSCSSCLWALLNVRLVFRSRHVVTSATLALSVVSLCARLLHQNSVVWPVDRRCTACKLGCIICRTYLEKPSVNLCNYRPHVQAPTPHDLSSDGGRDKLWACNTSLVNTRTFSVVTTFRKLVAPYVCVCLPEKEISSFRNVMVYGVCALRRRRKPRSLVMCCKLLHCPEILC